MNQRKKNSEMDRKLTAFCTTPSELGSMELFRITMLDAEKALIRVEMGRRARSICTHTQDKNLKWEQLKQLRSTLPVTHTLFWHLSNRITQAQSPSE